jgi:hypothetical protein
MAISGKSKDNIVKNEDFNVIKAVEAQQDDLVSGNEYLRKEQQKYFANQWVLQQNHYAQCGAVTKIKLDKDYEARGVSKEQENNIRIKTIIFEKLNLANQFTIGTTNYDPLKGDIEEFKKKMTELQKQVDEAEEDYIVYGAEIYFGIEKKTALEHFEEITPYVMGRKYLNDLRIVGTTFDDIKNGTVPKDRNNLVRFTRDLTDKHYY